MMSYNSENNFNKKLRSLKKYCPKAYKQLIFKIRQEINENLTQDGTYIKILDTSEEFKFVYGEITFTYRVNNGNLIIENLEPAQFLIDGYLKELDTYKGIYYRNDKDKFKIDLFKVLRRNYE